MQKNTLYIMLVSMMLGLASPSYGAEEKYPTIHNAIATLEQTKADLQNGEHGFGGHRSAAIEHIDAALKELHQALEYADTHPDEVKAPGKP